MESNNEHGLDSQQEFPNLHDDPELFPFVGKIFTTIEDAKNFYNNFAYRRGFSIRKGSHYKSSKSGELTSIKWVCSKEGLSKWDKESQKALENSSSQRTPEKVTVPTRTNCKARFRICFGDGIWKISSFQDGHNHPLFDSPSKKRNLRSHRSMDPEDKQDIRDMRAQNIETAKIHEYLGTKHGGRKFLHFKRKDVSNEIASQNQKLVGMDVETTLIYFQKKREEDPEFFYDVEVDESGRLMNMFWVDGRARRAFQEFGDIVTFDTTYQTNMYDLNLFFYVLFYVNASYNGGFFFKQKCI